MTLTLTVSGSRYTIHRNGCRYAGLARRRAGRYGPNPIRITTQKDLTRWIRLGAHRCGTCKAPEVLS